MHDTSHMAIIKHEADRSVQAKAGTGRISEQRRAKLEGTLKNNRLDFKAHGLELLNQLEEVLAKASSMDVESLKSEVTKPVLDLAGSAEMFKYKLIGDLAAVMLNFLEQVKRVDKDVIAIVESHHKTLKAILYKEMEGDGGTQGKVLKAELIDVCQRYQRHHQSSSLN